MTQAPTRRLTLPFTTWFGTAGRVTAGADGWHVAEVGRLRLPHPGLVNMILRAGPPEETLRLVVLHERGHFETAPAAALHLFWILGAALRSPAEPHPCRVLPPLRGFPRAVALAVSHHAAWEALAEAWVVRHEGRSYARGSTARQTFFWTVTLAMAFATFFLRRPGGDRPRWNSQRPPEQLPPTREAPR
ncbi:MAG: hypothetical protein M5U22_21305 [Thermoleophilia bacterium]|nr:hypothetical protein [Thermoleophilia bacterium]